MPSNNKSRFWLEKKARRKTGFPLATIAYYGPDDTFATKMMIRHGCDTHALGCSPDELRLYTLARREALQVLQAQGSRIVPPSEAGMAKLPVFLQVAGMRALPGTRFGEVGLGWHCSQAPDEIEQLARELMVLVDQSGLDTPAIRKVPGLEIKNSIPKITQGAESGGA